MNASWRVHRRALLRRAHALPALGGRGLVVAPHPDDETIGAGALIARAVAQGAEVHVVVVTDGAASHRTDDKAALVHRRRAEAEAACRQLGLGVDGLTFLLVPDQSVDRHRDLLEQWLVEHSPGGSGVDWVVAPCGTDAHPDHRACADVVGRWLGAHGPDVRPVLLSYPVWYWHRWAWMDPTVGRVRRLMSLVGGPLSAFLRTSTAAEYDPIGHRAKRAALAEYQSQLHGHQSDEASIDNDVIDRATSGVELFFASAGDIARLNTPTTIDLP